MPMQVAALSPQGLDDRQEKDLRRWSGTNSSVGERGLRAGAGHAGQEPHVDQGPSRRTEEKGFG